MKKEILLAALLIFACSNDEDEGVPNMCVDETLINLETACPSGRKPISFF